MTQTRRNRIPKSRAKTAYGLLSEIRRLILAEPRRYNQQNWRIESPAEALAPPCGTVCCVAGWVETLKYKTHVSSNRRDTYEWTDSPVFKMAQKTLGLSTDEARTLFDPKAAGVAACYWSKNPLEIALRHARSGADHIEAFQHTHAATLKAKRV